MGFLSDVFESGTNAIGSIAGGALGFASGGGIPAALGGASLGSVFNPTAEPPFDQDDILEQITLGNQQDLTNQKEMFDYRISQGRSQGLTPWEMYLGPAGGAGGGTTGSGQTLGNSATQMNAVRMKQQQDQKLAAMNIGGQLAQTKMQTDAQKEVALTMSGATVESANISARVQEVANQIKQGQLDLASKEFEEVTLPMAAEKLNLTEQQVKYETNKVATSTPEFLRAMKILTMSAENLVATIMVNSQPVDVTDPKQLAKLSVDQRSDLLTSMIGMSSVAYREASGIGAKSGDIVDQFLRASEKQVVRNIKNGIKQPSGAVTYPVLGNNTPGMGDVLKSMSGLGTMDQTFGH